jgi:hypothetical protein
MMQSYQTYFGRECRKVRQTRPKFSDLPINRAVGNPLGRRRRDAAFWAGHARGRR